MNDAKTKQDILKEIERTNKRILSARAHRDWKLLDSLYALKAIHEYDLITVG